MAPTPEVINTMAVWPKVSFHGPIRKAKTKAIRKKSKNSSASPMIAAARIFF